MKIKDLIEALQGYPEDMEVECLTSCEEIMCNQEGWVTEVEDTWELVSSVEMSNQYGNVVRIS